MSARTAALIPAALTAALIAGCGNTGVTPAGTTNANSGTNLVAAKHLSCHQQYENWRLHSGQLAIVQKLQADVTKLQSDVAAQDIPLTRADMVSIGTHARQLSAYHMPACADPAGYFSKWIAALQAVGDNAKSATGLGSILLAVAPLKQVKTLTGQLAGELHKTAGEG
jgi:hypothetical protein